MLQIDPLQFITQAIALSLWVVLAAAIYAVVENLLSTDREKS